MASRSEVSIGSDGDGVCIFVSETLTHPSLIILFGVFNTLRPRQKGRHLPDDIFKCISLYENV